jgi:hypothetical protein
LKSHEAFEFLWELMFVKTDLIAELISAFGAGGWDWLATLEAKTSGRFRGLHGVVSSEGSFLFNILHASSFRFFPTPRPERFLDQRVGFDS